MASETISKKWMNGIHLLTVKDWNGEKLILIKVDSFYTDKHIVYNSTYIDSNNRTHIQTQYVLKEKT